MRNAALKNVDWRGGGGEKREKKRETKRERKRREKWRKFCRKIFAKRADFQPFFDSNISAILASFKKLAISAKTAKWGERLLFRNLVEKMTESPLNPAPKSLLQHIRLNPQPSVELHQIYFLLRLARSNPVLKASSGTLLDWWLSSFHFYSLLGYAFGFLDRCRYLLFLAISIHE